MTLHSGSGKIKGNNRRHLDTQGQVTEGRHYLGLRQQKEQMFSSKPVESWSYGRQHTWQETWIWRKPPPGDQLQNPEVVQGNSPLSPALLSAACLSLVNGPEARGRRVLCSHYTQDTMGWPWPTKQNGALYVEGAGIWESRKQWIHCWTCELEMRTAHLIMDLQ